MIHNSSKSNDFKNDPGTSELYKKTLVTLIEASTVELPKLLPLNSFENLNFYGQVLLAYSEKNMILLNSFIDGFKVKNPGIDPIFDDFEIIKRLTELRYAIRCENIKWSHIATLLELESNVDINLWQIWKGEIYILIAFAYGEIGDDSKSSQYYKSAIDALTDIGANRKKTKAILNYAATLSSMNLNKYSIKEYLYVYKEAFKSKSYDCAALALANLAHEFQNFGLLRLADRYSKKSLLMISCYPSTLQYYFVLLNRAHILIDLDEIESAETLMATCKESKFSEIQGCLKILTAIINNTPYSYLKFSKKQRLLPGWLKRLKKAIKKGKRKRKSAFLEEKLIFFLSIKDRNKEEVIQYLYGNRLESEYTDNRFYVLLNRMDRKFPGLIKFSQQQKLCIQ